MSHLVRTELFKLRSTKGPWVASAAVVLAQLLFALLIGMQAESALVRNGLGPRAGVCTGYPVLLLGITAITQEYRYRTIVGAFLTTPARWRVLAAKAAAVAGLGAALSAVAQTIWLGAGLLRHGAAGMHLDQAGEVARLYWVTAAGVALLGVLGLALGTIVRNSTAALVVLIVGTIVEGALEQFRYKGPFTSGLQVLSDRTAHGVPPGLVALCLWVAVALCAALVVLRRDETDS
ncbi:ABC transporter permease [Streptomyces sp. NPDC053048]|uniref:ABC transporter permease n=1 Tax=Streptomyces sp. NPDC053048 TaxID=3365694 RepID=UPI0037D34E17